ncbi:MAG: sigma-70 family RNA polymerase sigma factor [Verrucomicrobia bacterium]|nr:sigma-70 family RNA polymerase sigma factor [Verrucomicrobiota bacterium]MBI3869553.1 sigma-70 family RNA polymerase sigma factor [Verrucomicrobiota bacterium]
MPGGDLTRPVGRGQDASFTTTHWSVVLAAGSADSGDALIALEKLGRSYWYPLYAFARRAGYSEHDAQDLTQGFFTHLIQKTAFRAITPERGRLRSFLLASLKNYMGDVRDRESAQKRGGGQVIVSIDAQEAEDRYRFEPQDPQTPEKLFERRWALTMLDSALEELESEARKAGRQDLFIHLRGSLVGGEGARTCADIAQTLGMSEESIKKALQRLRKRYKEVIREQIRQTVANDGDVEQELRELRASLED